MPTHRGIFVTLQSQFDALMIPEYPPSNQAPQDTGLSPPLGPTIETEIPRYPGSRFWIVYSCLPPVLAHISATDLWTPGRPASPLHHDVEGQQVKYFYFKLYLVGVSEAVVSWGVEAGQGWEGKVGFGFFDAERDFQGKQVVEKRGLFFGLQTRADVDDESQERDEGFQLKVFRAKGRIRERVCYPPCIASGSRGVSMNSIGRRKKGEPRRMYTYALLDGLDDPFAVFKYAFEPRLELDRGHTSSSESANTSENKYVEEDQASEVKDEEDQVDMIQVADAEDTEGQDEESLAPDHRDSDCSPSLPQYLAPLIQERSQALRRLSVPPRVELRSSSTHHEPSSPLKRDLDADENGVQPEDSHTGDPETTCSVNLSTLKKRDPQNLSRNGTPSDLNKSLPPSPTQEDECELTTDFPVESERTVTQPPASGWRKGSGEMLRNVIASALKRRARDSSRNASC